MFSFVIFAIIAIVIAIAVVVVVVVLATLTMGTRLSCRGFDIDYWGGISRENYAGIWRFVPHRKG